MFSLNCASATDFLSIGDLLKLIDYVLYFAIDQYSYLGGNSSMDSKSKKKSKIMSFISEGK